MSRRLARRQRNGLWALVLLVIVGLLAFGTLSRGEPSADQRVRTLEEQIRCPQCHSQSVAQSDTPSARGVKTIIKDQVKAGRSNEEILDYVAATYGRDVLLDPKGSGFSALVWAAPVVVVVAALAGLVYRFGDWRPDDTEVTDADRDLVAAALTRPATDAAAGDGSGDDEGAIGDGGAVGDGEDDVEPGDRADDPSAGDAAGDGSDGSEP